MTSNNDKVEVEEDTIQAEARIMAVLKTSYPKAYTAKAIQKSCQVYWKKHLNVLDRLVDEGVVEKIETFDHPVYRLVKK